MEMLLERACLRASKGFGIKLGDDRVSILVFIGLIIIFIKHSSFRNLSLSFLLHIQEDYVIYKTLTINYICFS